MSDELIPTGGASTRGELRDLTTALNQGWPIPPETLEAVPLKMMEFIDGGSRREATAAARVLVAMVKGNAAHSEPERPSALAPAPARGRSECEA